MKRNSVKISRYIISTHLVLEMDASPSKKYESRYGKVSI